ncbi:DMT family transporter [Deinococcus ruber]|uniref:Permease n=1 Tax=Deinococcus ruber TaxID=1848197 RepID=A0A918CHZ2_9DEIO|nr:DMT family transporter [Deinococcus ruber]GGR25298.1 permease [Deinococcus ruber]
MSAVSPARPRHANHALGLALLLIVTCIWGSTFAVVKTATDTLQPATLIFWRFAIGTLCILPLLLWKRQDSGTRAEGKPRKLWLDGLLLGVWLMAGYGTQTIALSTTSANRAAFITALSVVLVPLWQALVSGRRLGGLLWAAVALAVSGLALLSWEGGALGVGDLWALACAVTYAGFILMLEHTSRAHAALPYTLAQLGWVTLLALAWVLLSHAPLLPPTESWGALLYLGAAATAVTTLLQTLGQRWVSAAEASVLYALEPVTASVFSYFLLGERVYLRGFLGGAMVVGATILSQFGAGRAEVPQVHTEEEER